MRLLRSISAVQPSASRLIGGTTRSLPLLTHIRCASARPASWDYETEKRTFKLKAPEYYNFARDAIDAWAAKEKV